MSALSAQLGLWAGGLGDEIAFWRSWFASRGLQWPDDYATRFDPDLPLDPVLAAIAAQTAGDSVRILDVGAGPVTNVGRTLAGKRVELVACDPLAPIYDELIAEAGVAPPVRSRFAPAEDLSAFFEPSSFDIVHCRNALDHSVDPTRGLEEMLRVVRVGGTVVLRHHRNEAEREDYVGLHQLNIDARDGALVFWTRSETSEPLKRIPVRVDADIRLNGGDVEAVIVKRGEFPVWESAARTQERLRSLLEATIRVLASPPARGEK